MKKIYFIIFIIILFGALIFFVPKQNPVIKNPIIDGFVYNNPSPIPTLTPEPTLLKRPPPQKTLINDYQIFQSFNNCGPAALSMALSYYGINESQEKLGQDLRPYQNSQGDNDDKSVTLDELEEKAKEYDLIPYHRPNGNIDHIKNFISENIPVITRTLLTSDQDIGHYRVVKGYDDITGEIIQDDSLQGANLRYSYDEFNRLWKQFNYEYLVLVPSDKQEIAENILGEDIDEKTAWGKAVQKAKDQLIIDPNDIYIRFNLSVAFYNIGDYQNAILEFEKVEERLSFRTLWYQIEPIKAYFEIQNYDRVFFLSDKILNNSNRAFSELYILRGQAYEKRGNADAAKIEFDKAVFYNKNIKITY